MRREIMLILHCLWMDGDFFIWGEDDTTPLCIKMKGRPPKDTSRYEFPYLAGTQALECILKLFDETYVQREAVARLIVPTGKYLPTNSPMFIDEFEDRPYRLSPWKVKGVKVSASLFIEKLAPKTES